MRLVLLRDSRSVVVLVLHHGLLGKHHVQSEQNAQHGQHSGSSRRMRRAPHLHWYPAGGSSEMSTDLKQRDRQMDGRAGGHVGTILLPLDLADITEALPSVAH